MKIIWKKDTWILVWNCFMSWIILCDLFAIDFSVSYLMFFRPILCRIYYWHGHVASLFWHPNDALFIIASVRRYLSSLNNNNHRNKEQINCGKKSARETKRKEEQQFDGFRWNHTENKQLVWRWRVIWSLLIDDLEFWEKTMCAERQAERSDFSEVGKTFLIILNCYIFYLFYHLFEWIIKNHYGRCYKLTFYAK